MYYVFNVSAQFINHAIGSMRTYQSLVILGGGGGGNVVFLAYLRRIEGVLLYNFLCFYKQ